MTEHHITHPPSAASALVLRENFGTIAKLTLNRPHQYNPLSDGMLTELQASLDDLSTDKSIHTVIIAAAGKAFCAGHDLKEIRSHDVDFARQLFAKCSAMMMSILRLPQPVIAQVQGIATAAGCQLVASCDLAMASSEAEFAVSGANLGLFCSTPAVALSRSVSRKTALEMLFTGEFIDADTAVAKGLVNRAVDAVELENCTMQLARSIAEKPREALALGKRVFYEQIEQGVSRAYATASDGMVCNLRYPETAEGIDAFIQKRKPSWLTVDHLA